MNKKKTTPIIDGEPMQIQRVDTVEEVYGKKIVAITERIKRYEEIIANPDSPVHEKYPMERLKEQVEFLKEERSSLNLIFMAQRRLRLDPGSDERGDFFGRPKSREALVASLDKFKHLVKDSNSLRDIAYYMDSIKTIQKEIDDLDAVEASS